MKKKYLALAASLALGTLSLPLHAAGGEVADRIVKVCESCHGEGGVSTTANIPNLAGQQPVYFTEQLMRFRAEKRSEVGREAYMWGISALLDDAQISALADHFAAQKPAPGKPWTPKLVEKGKAIYEKGIPGKKVQACASCHGAGGEGQAAFPRLTGQHAGYIINQMRAFRTVLRPSAKVMSTTAKAMSQDEIEAVAFYLQSK